MIYRTGIYLFFFFLLADPSSAQKTARGIVYHDINQNNQMDTGEKGIENVAVSNGKEVVLTDGEGLYELPVGNDNIIFVIKPSGYRLPVNEKQLPQFYYIHKPKGSPDLNFKGVEPTGPLPELVNFPLVETDEKEEFSILLFGDPQPYNEKEMEYFKRDIVSELHEVDGYEFGITLGDIVGDDLDLFQPYIQSVAQIGIPWFNVYGNHDMNFDAESDLYADETFESTFGPSTYSFNHGKVHFILLDDVIYPRKDGRSGYIGGFTEQQLEFIENDLRYVPKDHLVVLAFHIPIFLPDGRRTFRVDDREHLFDLLEEFPNTLSLSAHTHMQKFHFFDEKDGWKQFSPHAHYNVGTASGDWWSGEPDDRGIPPTTMRDGTPNGYAFLNIEGSSYTIDYKVADKGNDYRMSIWGPEVVPQKGWSWHRAELYVNYFLGNAKTKVEYQLPGETEWRQMNKVEEHDPKITAIRNKWDTSENLSEGIRPLNPVASSHLWKAPIPNNILPVGEQQIKIRVKDIFGRIFKDEYSFMVVEE